MYFQLEFEVKKLYMSDFVILVSSHVKSYLVWVISQVAALASLILESLYYKWRDFISSISSLHPFLLLFLFIYASFHSIF